MTRCNNLIKEEEKEKHVAVQTSRLLFHLMEVAIFHLPHVNPQRDLIHQNLTAVS